MKNNSQTVITTTSSSSRRALQKELENTIVDRNDLNLKLETVQDSIMSLDSRLLELAISNEDERELGPLKYIAETTGQDMGQVVNWFLLLIIFVFDPLAIALVVAANFAFSQIRKPEIDFDLDNPPPANDKLKNGAKKYKEIKIEKVDIVMDDMEDTPRKELDIDEKRMNVIGQNGNDGLHYDDIDTPLDRLTDTTQTLIVNKKEGIRVINSEKDLNEEELIMLSKEIGKTEQKRELTPVNPTEKDLENLANALNIKYANEKDEKNTLRYKGR